jgi:hypothetical protein
MKKTCLNCRQKFIPSKIFHEKKFCDSMCEFRYKNQEKVLQKAKKSL